MKKILFLITFTLLNLSIYSQTSFKIDEKTGVFNIPCKVNGIPMNFIFDTGASNVSISLTEASFLLKQGLLKENDFKKSVNFKIANGEIFEGTEVVLREIEIAGLTINNITATIVHEQNAPLLLGMSALSKLGPISFDDNNLIIGNKEEISSNEIIMKNTITENLSFSGNSLIVKCEFNDNFLGIQTLFNSKKDLEIDQKELNSNATQLFLDKLYREFALTQLKKIIIDNGMWIRQLQTYNYEIIAFKFDYFFKNTSTTSLYAISIKMLLEILTELNETNFNKILINQNYESKLN